MNRLLEILKIQHKILIIWILAALVPVISLLTSKIHSGNDLNQLQNIKQTYEILNLVKDAKHFLKHDLLIASEILFTTKSNKSNELWELHMGMADEIKDITTYLLSQSSNLKIDTSYHKEKQLIVVAVKNITTIYNNKILADYRLLFKKSNEQSNTTNEFQQDDNEFSNFEEYEELDNNENILIYDNLKKEATSCFRLLIQIEEQILGIQNTNTTIINEKQQYQNSIQIIIITVMLLLSLFTVFFVYNHFKEKLLKINIVIKKIASGETSKLKVKIGNNELSELSQSVSNLNNEMNKFIDYCNNIEQKNYNSIELPFAGDGVISTALKKMTQSLIEQNTHQKKAELEEKITDWTAKGITLFAHILRGHDNDTQIICKSVINQLVKYMEATQGAIYLIEENDEKEKFFKLTSCIAYNQKRMAKQRIELNEGLLGRCYYEQKSIYLKDLPDDYLKIKSGLGELPPRNMLISPLIFENQMVGVIELASFKIFKNHEIEFLVGLGENIAQTIIRAKNITHTAVLLDKTKLQTEELISQEEELRQNMEEMRATQEEASRKEKMSVGFANTVNHTLIRADFDNFGRFIYGNSIFLSTIGIDSKEAHGRDISFMVIKNEATRIGKIIDNIAEGAAHFEGIITFTNNNEHVPLLTTITGVRDDNGKVEKILLLAFNLGTLKN